MKKRKRKLKGNRIHILTSLISLHLLLDLILIPTGAAALSVATIDLIPSHHQVLLLNGSRPAKLAGSSSSLPEEQQSLKLISRDQDDLLAVESSPMGERLNLKQAPYEVQPYERANASASKQAHILPLMFVPHPLARQYPSSLAAAARKVPQNSYSPGQDEANDARKSPKPEVFQFPAGEREGDFSALSAGQYQRTRPSGETASWLQLLRQATESNVMESLMVTNRSVVSLLCDSNEMLVKLRFRQPFTGSVITNRDDLSNQCRLQGDGRQYYEMRISLHQCGTRQEVPRLFINNIHIHHRSQHPSSSLANLTADEDEMKTIVCSYPMRPRAPPPPSGLPERIIEAPVAPEEPARLVHYEPLVLIASLLLVSLTVFGLTTGAYLATKRFRRRRRSPESFAPSHLYRSSPSRLANLAVPPLIGLGKPETSRSRVLRYPQSGGTWQSKSRSASGDRSSQVAPEARVERADSLSKVAQDRQSGSTIVIPATETKIEPSESKSQDRRTSSMSRIPKLVEEPLRDMKSYTLDKRSRSKTTKMTYTTNKRRQAPKMAEPPIRSSPPAKFGSLRSSLTSPNEFKRLQKIVSMFDEILIERQVDTNGNEVLVSESRLNPSKYRQQIMDIMDSSEIGLLRSLLNQDELFRSLVVEATSREVFDRKLRTNPVYANRLQASSWELLERILLDTKLADDERAQQVENGTYTRWRKRARVVPYMGVSQTEPDGEADAEVRALMAAGSPTRRLDDSNQANLDSLESSPGYKVSTRTLVDSRNSPDGEPAAYRSVVRVSKLGGTRSRADLRSTQIHVDSVTSFASSSGDFSTYTRSTIERSEAN